MTREEQIEYKALKEKLTGVNKRLETVLENNYMLQDIIGVHIRLKSTKVNELLVGIIVALDNENKALKKENRRSATNSFGGRM